MAFAGRAIFLASTSAPQADDHNNSDALVDLIIISLSNALLGMDANDPPKTLATMQLIGSIFSNVGTFVYSCTCSCINNCLLIKFHVILVSCGWRQ